MIRVGLDDTDTLLSPGTNKVARGLAQAVVARFPCRLIVRHQLLVDPAIPYTSHNGSASLLFEGSGAADRAELAARLAELLRADFVPGSDPGLCVAELIPEPVMAFGRRCQRAVVCQDEARRLAAEHGLFLEGLGGTEGGIIGALAAVGLAAEGDDGRIVQLGSRDDESLSGPQPIGVLFAHGIAEVRCIDDGAMVLEGVIDIGKKLRPNLRAGRAVLYVEAADGIWTAVRCR